MKGLIFLSILFFCGDVVALDDRAARAALASCKVGNTKLFKYYSTENGEALAQMACDDVVRTRKGMIDKFYNGEHRALFIQNFCENSTFLHVQAANNQIRRSGREVPSEIDASARDSYEIARELCSKKELSKIN